MSTCKVQSTNLRAHFFYIECIKHKIIKQEDENNNQKPRVRITLFDADVHIVREHNGTIIDR